MARIDRFVLVDGMSDGPFITLRNTGIAFSMAAIECMGRPKYVHMYVNEEDHQVAFKPCEPDSAALRFYTEPKEGRQVMVRINGKQKVQLLMGLAGIEDCGKGIRYYGEFVADEDLLIFTLRK